MENTLYKRDEESAKKIRNEIELIMLLNGDIVDYEEIYNRFEISQKTFKRDMQSIKIAVTTIFTEDARLLKVRDKLAYKLYIPHKPLLLY